MRSPFPVGVAFVPIISGTLGPYTSASSRPVLYPRCASAIARFTETVVFPTPPLPLPTAIRFFTPGMGSFGCCCCCPGLIYSHLIGEAGSLELTRIHHAHPMDPQSGHRRPTEVRADCRLFRPALPRRGRALQPRRPSRRQSLRLPHVELPA